jgi:molecular chaperone HscB
VAAASRSASDSLHGPPDLAAGLERFDPTLDHFARFGLAPRWQLDRNLLEDRYLERSRVVHPDRHATADAATRRAALEHSAALNEAYAVLRDPVRRAEYLVKLGGVDLDSSDPKTGAPHPEQAFLIEMIERREQLEQIVERGANVGRGAREDALDELREAVEAEQASVFDRAIAGLDRADIRAAAAALVHRRYLQRFVTEIQAAS